MSYVGKTVENEILFHDSKSIYRYRNGQINKEQIFRFNDVKNKIRQFYKIDDSEYVMIFEFGRIDVKKIKGSLTFPKMELNYTNDVVHLGKYLFLLKQKKGLNFVNVDKKNIIQKEFWFPEQFISHINLGTEGKILLGTFNNGIHIIPNRSVYIKDVIPKETECRTFCVHEVVFI